MRFTLGGDEPPKPTSRRDPMFPAEQAHLSGSPLDNGNYRAVGETRVAIENLARYNFWR